MVKSASGSNKQIPQDKLEQMSKFLNSMNQVTTNRFTREMITFLGESIPNVKDLTIENITSKFNFRYGKDIDFYKKYGIEGRWSNLAAYVPNNKQKGPVTIYRIREVGNAPTNYIPSSNIAPVLKELFDMKYDSPESQKEYFDKFARFKAYSKNPTKVTQTWTQIEFGDSDFQKYMVDLSNNLEKVKSAFKLFDPEFNLGSTLGVFIKNLTKTNTPEMERVNIDVFGEDKGKYFEISNVAKEKINERFKVENPEKIIIEHILLKVMTQNCKLRVVEGKMINDSLIEMKDQIKNMIIDSAGIPGTSLYWDTLYHPYCYNLNIMSNKVFVKPERSDVNSSVIVNQLKELSEGPVKFIVFTVLNTNSNKNNPPNPPFYNLNNAKFYYINKQNNKLKIEMGKLLNKAKEDSFYETNDFIKNKTADTIDVTDFKAFMEIFDKNNSATLIGTIDATEELQKLNMNYMCQESDNKKKLLNLFSSTFPNFLTIRGDGEFSKKYQITNSY